MAILSLVGVAGNLNATSPPFKGGSLYIQSVESANRDCYFRGSSSFPATVRQYFYNGRNLWQIKLDDGKVQIREISLKSRTWVGYKTLQDVATEMQDQEYPCAFHVNVNPDVPSQNRIELQRIRLHIGSIVNEGGAWYWANTERTQM